MISLHSHSGTYCAHAKGTLESVVKEAIKKQFKVYGLSEHQPRRNHLDLYPDEANLTTDLLSRLFDDYYTEACRLKLIYKNEITILIGFETEYILRENNDPISEIRNLTNTYKFDYIVGSVHHVNGMMIDYDLDSFNRAESATLDLFNVYFDHQYDLLLNVKPTVVGHFDLCRMFRPEQELTSENWDRINRNIDLIKEYGGLVELNSRAFKKGLKWIYPFKDILQVMVAKDLKFTISDDSHGPNDVGMFYPQLFDCLKEIGITRVYYPEGESLSKIDIKQ